MNNVKLHRLPSQPLIQTTQNLKQQLKIESSFGKHLAEALQTNQLKISKHAHERLQERGITISDTEWASITAKVQEAKQKGVRDSLVLLQQAALIVSAKNSTVITAMDRNEASNQLFTNIDGTILMH